MENATGLTKELVLEDVIATSVQIPGVKVNRNGFLSEQFASSQIDMQKILDLGPIEAGISQEEITNAANKLIIKRTSQSSIASFVTGIPGGLAMAATIPADVMQFFGMALRLAQELSYLYGGEDLWTDGKIDDEKVKSQLIMYCGVMFGVSGAVSGVRVLTTQIAKTTIKKLPQKALTKTFWYPILKQIGKAVGLKVTKSSLAKGLSKAVPIVGGVISGGLNFASMLPMANRLNEALNKAAFDYSEQDLLADIETIENISEEEDVGTDAENTVVDIKEKMSSEIKAVKSSASRFASKISKKVASAKKEDPVEAVKKYKELLDIGAITQEEYDLKKKELLGL